MRIDEVRRKKTTPPEPFDPYKNAYERLQSLIQEGYTQTPNGTRQLFIPRKIEWNATTKHGMRRQIWKKYAKYAYDDEGNLKPEYQRMIDNLPEIIGEDGPPILAGGSVGGHRNKPLNATLWTSTAKRLDNGKYISDWSEYGIAKNANVGYLYDVKPNTRVLELNDDYQVKYIYNIFQALDRKNKATLDDENWKNPLGLSSDTELKIMEKDFPWEDIQKNFDCVHHNGMPPMHYGGTPFLYGWDVESTAWLNPNQLILLGQVQVNHQD